MRTVCKVIEKEESVVIKFRDKTGISYQVFPFTNYFYVEEEDFEQISYIVVPRAKDLKTVIDRNGKRFVRIYLKNNFHRNMIRNDIEENGVSTYEADINAPKRMLIENQDFPLNQEGLRFAFLDIETDDRENFTYDKQGDLVPLSAITSVAVKEFDREGDGKVWYVRNRAIDGIEFDEYRELRKELNNIMNQELPTKEIYDKLKPWKEKVTDALFKGEEILLKKLFEYIKEFDVVSGWNSSHFDDPWIRFRAKSHKMDFDGLNLIGFDYLESYRKNHYTPVKSFALNNVSYEELKSELEKENSNLNHPEEIKKLNWKVITKVNKYFDMFLLFPEVHKEYNIQDVQLLDMLEKKLGLFKLHQVQSKKAHCLLIATLYNSKICDMMVLNEARKRNIIKISKPSEIEMNKRSQTVPIGGGYTTANKGIYDNAVIFDFASHYTQIIRSFGISPENYLRSVMPDLSKVFSATEILYIQSVMEIRQKHIDKTYKLNKAKYEKEIEERRIQLEVDNMETLMWKFTEYYDQKIEHKDNECYTPSDFNKGTRGWEIYPHFVFDKKERGIYPTILDDLSDERDKIKYSLEKYEKGSFEWQEHNYYQLGLKLNSNSLYGFILYKGSRDYKLDVGNAITSTARYLTKICMLESKKQGMILALNDTDSVIGVIDKSKEFFDDKFKELMNKTMIVFDTSEFGGKKHSIKFEYEGTYDKLIVIAKKRYYYSKDGDISGKGGYNVRSDTLLLTKELQEELLEDIFNNNFDAETWKQKLLNLKTKVFEHKLEEKYLIKIYGLGRPVETYGQPVTDSSTGLQKIRKSDGEPMFSPIPAGVLIAKKMIEEGFNVSVKDKLKYIVLKEKPKIQPITVKEYRELKTYDAKYYYDRIIKGVLEIMLITHPDLVYGLFKDCWGLSDRQIVNLKKKMDVDEEEDE